MRRLRRGIPRTDEERGIELDGALEMLHRFAADALDLVVPAFLHAKRTERYRKEAGRGSAECRAFNEDSLEIIREHAPEHAFGHPVISVLRFDDERAYERMPVRQEGNNGWSRSRFLRTHQRSYGFKRS